MAKVEGEYSSQGEGRWECKPDGGIGVRVVHPEGRIARIARIMATVEEDGSSLRERSPRV